MTYRTMENTIIVRLEPGEEIVTAVRTICEKEKVKSAIVHGIGTVANATTAIFDTATQTYKETEFGEFMELVSLEGNMTKMYGEAYMHLHAVFGDSEGRAFGGHLVKATVGGTAEIFLNVLPEEIRRIHQSETGLNIFAI